MNVVESTGKIFWKQHEREIVALAFAKSIEAHGRSLSQEEHTLEAQKGLPENRRRNAVSLTTERVKLRTLGYELLEKESLAIATQPIMVMPVRPSHISIPGSTGVNIVSAKPASDQELQPVTDGVNEAIAKYIKLTLPDMLTGVMMEIKQDLKLEMRAHVDAQISGISKKESFSITFFPRSFDSDDHGELAGVLPAATVVKPRTVNIAIVGLLDRHISLIKNKFVKENVFFRFLSKDDIRRAVKSTGNMDHILVVRDFVSHALTESLSKKPDLKSKIRLISGQITGLTTEIESILAAAK